MKLVVTAIGLAGVFALTACSTPGASYDAPSPSTVPSSSSTNAAKETPKLAGKKIDTPKGSYIQATFPETYPNYKPNPKIIEQGVTAAGFTQDDIQSAKKFVIDFIITEGINSKANNGGQTVDAWLAENKALFSPKWYPEIVSDVKENDAQIILAGRWTKDYAGYNYVYGENETRHTNVAVIPTKIWAVTDAVTKSGESSDGLAIESDVSFNSNVVSPKGERSQTATSGKMTYSVEKDGKGGWLITGYNHNI
jgi:hypothetical protein